MIPFTHAQDGAGAAAHLPHPSSRGGPAASGGWHDRAQDHMCVGPHLHVDNVLCVIFMGMFHACGALCVSPACLTLVSVVHLYASSSRTLHHVPAMNQKPPPELAPHAAPTPLGIPVAGPIRPGASGGSKPSGDTGGSGGGPGGGSAGGKPAGAGASTGSKAAGAGGPSSPSGAGGSGAPSKPKNGTSLGGKGGATAAADSKTKPGPSKVGGSTSFDAKAVAKKAAEVDKKHKLPKSAFSYFFARHKAECEVLFPEANYTQVLRLGGMW